MGLERYREKRDFERTAEPAGKVGDAHAGPLTFVIQKHAASRLHYDFRLELDGVLKSWAVPKGPSLDPGTKRLAMHVEDHPLEYGSFEGIIPKGEYGGGTVMLWDRGHWVPERDAAKDYRRGRLKFRLEGEKLRGTWNLVRMGRREGRDENSWLLIKENDEEARPGDGDAITDERPESVATGRTLREIADERDRVWSSTEGEVTVPAPEPTELSGVRRGALPETFEPQLATLGSEAPDGDDWLHEMKLDGYRILCRIDGDDVRLLSRNGKDWTDRFREVADAAGSLHCETALLDGEVVVLDAGGISDFQALQNALTAAPAKRRLHWFGFDIVHLDGVDVRAAPLTQRKELLATLLENVPRDGIIRYSDHVRGSGPAFHAQACQMGLEGTISKRADAPYRSGRSTDWRKTKCTLRQEFVITGYTEPKGSRTGFGALLLAVNDEEGRLVDAGRVGTGFTTRTLQDLYPQLRKRERDAPAIANPPRGAAARDVHWVEPELIAEVAFTEWTADGAVRHPSFQGLREDKRPEEIVRETGGSEPRAKARGNGSKARNGPKAQRDGPAAQRNGPTEERQPKAQRDGPTEERQPAAQRNGPTEERQPTAQRNGPTGERQPTAQRKGAKAQRRKGEVEIAGVRLSSPDRVLFPEQGTTKQELAEYYEAVADRLLPHLVDRPLTLVRCPAGRGGDCFYQKHAKDGIPDIVPRVDVPEDDGVAQYMRIADLSSVIALVQLGVLEFHVWGARADRLDRPDRLIFDLDPDPDLKWTEVVAAAFLLRQRLAELGLVSFVKTTGGKGLHVLFPIERRTSWDDAKAFTQAIAAEFTRTWPHRFVDKMTKKRRTGRIYIDFLRNAFNATSVAAYSTRARPGAPVSVPLTWDELMATETRPVWDIETVPQRLRERAEDPWAEVGSTRQSLTRAMLREVGLRG